jgi:translation initiation factor 3 subunit B
LKLVYWVPGTESIPSRVALWDLSSRQIVRTKNLFSVHDVQVHWQSEGEFLAVQVDRYAHKNKKTLSTNIELFRLKARDIPVEVVDCGSECVDHVSWEPQGNRFLTNQSVEFKSIVNIFQVTPNTVKSLRTVERKQLTRWSWSPRGNFFVLAGLDSTSAFLEFWSAEEGICMSTKEHFMATDMEWDPSGRFVASWVSYWRHQMENGFMLWDFRGELVTKQMQPRFTAFAWRPRPASLLSKDQVRDIRKNLKTLSVRFEQEDTANQQQSSTDTTESKKKVLEEWVIYRMKCQEALAGRAKQRQPVAVTAAPVGESKIVQEWIEDEVLENLEEVIPE